MLTDKPPLLVKRAAYLAALRTGMLTNQPFPDAPHLHIVDWRENGEPFCIRRPLPHIHCDRRKP